MSQIRFTDIAVSKLKEGVYFDETTASFGIRVGKTRRTWFVLRGRQRERICFGHYPALPLAVARKQARRLLAGEPEDTTRITFEEALEDFQTLHCSQKRTRTQRDYLRILSKHYAPELTGKRLSAITHRTVAEITDRLIDTPSERSHAIAVGRTFFRFCVRRRYIAHSPLEGMQLPKSTPRARLLTDDEIRSIWTACDHVEDRAPNAAFSCIGDHVSRLPGAFSTIVKLLILTGQRRNEIASLEASWIKDDRIEFPAHICKNNRSHVIPLGSPTSELLKSSSRQDGLLFSARGRSDAPFSGWSKGKAALDRRLGETVGKWNLHLLRHYFASTMARIGVKQEATERLLNHRSGIISGIAAVYQHHDFLGRDGPRNVSL